MALADAYFLAEANGYADQECGLPMSLRDGLVQARLRPLVAVLTNKCEENFNAIISGVIDEMDGKYIFRESKRKRKGHLIRPLPKLAADLKPGMSFYYDVVRNLFSVVKPKEQIQMIKLLAVWRNGTPEPKFEWYDPFSTKKGLPVDIPSVGVARFSSACKITQEALKKDAERAREEEISQGRPCEYDKRARLAIAEMNKWKIPIACLKEVHSKLKLLRATFESPAEVLILSLLMMGTGKIHPGEAGTEWHLLPEILSTICGRIRDLQGCLTLLHRDPSGNMARELVRGLKAISHLSLDAKTIKVALDILESGSITTTIDKLAACRRRALA